MPTTQASPAVGATRPLRRRAATGRGGTSHQTQSSKRVRAKTDALTLLSQAYFRSAVKVKPSARKRDLDRDRIPAFSKAGIRHPPPRHRGYAAKPPTATAADASRLCRPRRRRRPSGLRARYAGALRRGGRDFTPNAVSKRVRAKLMPLPSYRKRIFRSAVKVKPSARKRDLDRDRIPAFSKAGIRHPLPATAATPLSPPTATAADASRLCRPRRRRRPSGLRARYAGALRRGGEGLHTKRSLPRG